MIFNNRGMVIRSDLIANHFPSQKIDRPFKDQLSRPKKVRPYSDALPRKKAYTLFIFFDIKSLNYKSEKQP